MDTEPSEKWTHWFEGESKISQVEILRPCTYRVAHLNLVKFVPKIFSMRAYASHIFGWTCRSIKARTLIWKIIWIL